MKLPTTTYFLVLKKWAMCQNFSDVIDFLRFLGDQYIDQHLRECNNHASCKSEASMDEFLKCLSKHLEDEFLNRLIAEHGFTLMANKTTGMGDPYKLCQAFGICYLLTSILVRYVDFGRHEIEDQFLGIVEVVGSKGAEALCAKICNVLQEKGVNMVSK